MMDRSKPEAELVICISNELNELKRRVEGLEQLSADFRRNMTIDFVNTINSRFEKIENAIEDFNYKIEACKTDEKFINTINERFEKMEKVIGELGDKIDYCKIENLELRKLIKDAKVELNDKMTQIERKRLQEKQMEAALKKLAGHERTKVDKKLLEELRK